MNYLAHVAVAEPTDDARLGALLGDFAKGLDEARLPVATRDALLEHRAVDVWFDGQPEVRSARQLFPAELRRFSGILIDVFVDHVLVKRWDRLRPGHLGDAELPDVTGSLYRSLHRHAPILPPRLQAVAPSMIEHDWLGSYGRVENVERALLGLARRFKRPTPIASGIDVLRAHPGAFEELTLDVFPRAARWTRARRQGQSPPK